ncbi:haloalkane dehalogenase [Endozoicomonas sp. G2_2]|uniref:haloalkane dehalogenase n=1 Tax=Endozoicomonas sp. G2_2 TaxID=2821092 RepID=UPI001ADC6691|nr:haloalkane dehalogenase [Endozoicomonas sp. G2_2]MBO9471381.1 haloalkane dehalogenase [Endozoicomonas sp. G2_2]
MSTPAANDPHPRQTTDVLDSHVRYVDVGSGAPVVFLHGNPTSSYLWRNVIPPVLEQGRCLAPDLIGMGESGASTEGRYGFADHARYLDAWFDAVLPDEDVTLVLHDWGGGLGFDWARRHAERVRAIVYMETIVCPVSWDDWPDDARGIFQAFRSDKGEDLILERNFFVERVLPSSVLRELSNAELERYRAPYTEPGESRRPTLTWPREIPIDGTPAPMVEIVSAYDRWLEGSDVPKLFINAEPGSILTGPQRDYCRSWPNQEEITVAGSHFIQEDSPDEIGHAIADFLTRVR